MLTDILGDEYFMNEALKEAQKAFDMDEIPVGAVIVNGNKIIARAHNQTELLKDFTAHAEMIAYTSASNFLANKYLDTCTLYVTLEPCVMCTGAAFWTQIGKIVYGCKDKKRGFSAAGSNLLHPSTEIQGGILEEACSAILSNYFKLKR
jgi:tRNA(adenine34) deaminase